MHKPRLETRVIPCLGVEATSFLVGKTRKINSARDAAASTAGSKIYRYNKLQKMFDEKNDYTGTTVTGGYLEKILCSTTGEPPKRSPLFRVAVGYIDPSLVMSNLYSMMLSKQPRERLFSHAVSKTLTDRLKESLGKEWNGKVPSFILRDQDRGPLDNVVLFPSAYAERPSIGQIQSSIAYNGYSLGALPRPSIFADKLVNGCSFSLLFNHTKSGMFPWDMKMGRSCQDWPADPEAIEQGALLARLLDLFVTLPIMALDFDNQGDAVKTAGGPGAYQLWEVPSNLISNTFDRSSRTGMFSYRSCPATWLRCPFLMGIVGEQIDTACQLFSQIQAGSLDEKEVVADSSIMEEALEGNREAAVSLLPLVYKTGRKLHEHMAGTPLGADRPESILFHMLTDKRIPIRQILPSSAEGLEVEKGGQWPKSLQRLRNLSGFETGFKTAHEQMVGLSKS